MRRLAWIKLPRPAQRHAGSFFLSSFTLHQTGSSLETASASSVETATTGSDITNTFVLGGVTLAQSSSSVTDLSVTTINSSSTAVHSLSLYEAGTYANRSFSLSSFNLAAYSSLSSAETLTESSTDSKTGSNGTAAFTSLGTENLSQVCYQAQSGSVTMLGTYAGGSLSLSSFAFRNQVTESFSYQKSTEDSSSGGYTVNDSFTVTGNGLLSFTESAQGSWSNGSYSLSSYTFDGQGGGVVHRQLPKWQHDRHASLWAHNGGGDYTPRVKRKIPRDELKYKPAKRGAAPIGEDGHPVEMHHTDQRKGDTSPRAERPGVAGLYPGRLMPLGPLHEHGPWKWLGDNRDQAGWSVRQLYHFAWNRALNSHKTLDPLGMASSRMWNSVSAGSKLERNFLAWVRDIANAVVGFLNTITFGQLKNIVKLLVGPIGWAAVDWLAEKLEGYIDPESAAYRTGQHVAQLVEIVATLTPLGMVGTVIRATGMLGSALNMLEAARDGDWNRFTQSGLNFLLVGLRGITRCMLPGDGALRVVTNLGFTTTMMAGVASSVSSAVDRFEKGDNVGGVLDLIQAGASIFQASRACFTREMLLDTKEGKTRAEFIKEGDFLWSRSEFDPYGPIELKEVEEVFTRVSPILNVHVAGQILRTTPEHPFRVFLKGWVPAAMLEIGDLLMTRGGLLVPVEGVADSGQVETVYNWRIAEYHTYFVSATEAGPSIWAHNAYTGAKPGPKKSNKAPHNAKIIAEAKELKKEGNVIVAGGREKPERRVPTPGGKKTGRRPDILYETPRGTRRGRNVGRRRRDGSPVPRETDALNDLNGPGGLPTDFVPYN